VRAETRRLLGLAWPERAAIGAAALLGFATLGSGVGLMATSAYLIASAALHPPLGALQVAIVGVRFLGTSRGLLRYLDRLVSHDVALRLLARLRVFVYGALVPLAPARLQPHRSGDLVGRLVADVETLEGLYTSVVGPTLAAVLAAAVVAALLWPRGPWLAVAALAGLAAAGALLPLVAAPWGDAAGEAAVATRSGLEALVVDGVQGVGDLLAFDRGAAHVEAVEAASRSLVAQQGRQARASALGSALTTLASDLTVVAVLALAIRAAAAGSLPPVQIAVATLLALAAFEAVAGLPAAYQGLGAVRAAARRLFELTDTPPLVADPAEPRRLGDGAVLEVRDLAFTYPGEERPTLDGIRLEIARGRVVALVGPSGSGKSTLVSLLLRFWDAPPGSIRIDGNDVREAAADDVRARIACVAQRTRLFTGTIRDNLQLARPAATAEERADAARRAGLADFLASLPEGDLTWIGEEGLRLSGGERRRVALARAFLSDAPFLVLDEPTADLDAITERAVLETILAERARRGILLVTHRLVALESADEVVVLRGGRIVERGRFSELAAADGLLARMLGSQRRAAAIAGLEREAAESRS
jgi:thiol reductant ABC exporter CydC subunit